MYKIAEVESKDELQYKNVCTPTNLLHTVNVSSHGKVWNYTDKTVYTSIPVYTSFCNSIYQKNTIVKQKLFILPKNQGPDLLTAWAIANPLLALKKKLWWKGMDTEPILWLN